MSRVKIAVVGMGIGRPNGRALAKNPRGVVVALCDLVEERMQAFAEELPNPVKFYTDYKEMCQDPEIDAVFVGTPNQWHAPIGREAVRNGKHVLITKPLADSEEAAEQLVSDAESAGVVNMMSLATRFSDACQYLGGLAREGYFGELYYAKARSIRRNGIPVWRGSNQLRLEFIQKGGGAFRDIGVHVLDAVWWLLGKPKPLHVLGTGGSKFGPHGAGYTQETPKDIYEQFAVDDYAGGFIAFEGGIGLQVERFWASHQPTERQIELFGTDGGAQLSPLTIYRMENGVEQNLTPEPIEKMEGFDRIANHFIGSILDGEPCKAPLRDGLIVQQMMEAVLNSAETGQPVAL